MFSAEWKKALVRHVLAGSTGAAGGEASTGPLRWTPYKDAMRYLHTGRRITTGGSGLSRWSAKNRLFLSLEDWQPIYLSGGLYSCTPPVRPIHLEDLQTVEKAELKGVGAIKLQTGESSTSEWYATVKPCPLHFSPLQILCIAHLLHPSSWKMSLPKRLLSCAQGQENLGIHPVLGQTISTTFLQHKKPTSSFHIYLTGFRNILENTCTTCATYSYHTRAQGRDQSLCSTHRSPDCRDWQEPVSRAMCMSTESPSQ
jgi:hypothetical protein